MSADKPDTKMQDSDEGAPATEAPKLKVAKVRLTTRLPGGVDRMCTCGHTLGAHRNGHPFHGQCMDAHHCGCEGFYPEEF